MKKKLSFFLIAMGLLFATQFNANAASQSFIIGDDWGGITVIPNDYMNAISVDIELILEDGSIFARATTSAGNAVSFNVGSARVRTIKSSYKIIAAEGYIIQDDWEIF